MNIRRHAILLIILIINGNLSFAQQIPLAHFINEYAHKNNFNGTILVQSSDSTIYQNSYGVAERSFNTPINDSTRFKIASITKTFTAVLILKLYDQGRLDINKPFRIYLPLYQGEAKDKVNIIQLLNHTSGLPNTDTVSSMENALRYGIGSFQHPYTTQQMMDKFCSGNLIHFPGSTFSYNNADYIILGKILESVYDKPFEKILQDELLTPLGMKNSGMLAQRTILTNFSNSYYRLPNKSLINDPPMYSENWYAAGGMYSCTYDLKVFFSKLFSGQLLKKNTLEKMTTPGLDDYGYSIWIRDSKGEQKNYKRIERYGSIAGVNAVVMHFLSKNVTIIILSNTNMTNVGEYALKIGKAVF